MLWTVAYQVPQSIGFSGKNGAGCILLQELPDPRIESHLLYLLYWQAGSLLLVAPGKPWHMVSPQQMPSTCIIILYFIQHSLIFKCPQL